MNAYCPECETELDITTGICPACRWDPMVARTVQEPQQQEPEMSLPDSSDHLLARVGIGALALEDGPDVRDKLRVIRCTAERVVDRRRRTGVVTLPHCLRRHLHEPRRIRVFGGAFVADEEERLVLLDRAADGGAELVVDELGLVLVAVTEVRIGHQMLIGVVPEA